MLKLRFGELLQKRGITAYAVWRESGLARNTVYDHFRDRARPGWVIDDPMGPASEPLALDLREASALAAFRETALIDLGSRLMELEAIMTAEERRDWREAMASTGCPARYVPGRGFVVEGEARAKDVGELAPVLLGLRALLTGQPDVAEPGGSETT